MPTPRHMQADPDFTIARLAERKTGKAAPPRPEVQKARAMHRANCERTLARTHPEAGEENAEILARADRLCEFLEELDRKDGMLAAARIREEVLAVVRRPPTALAPMGRTVKVETVEAPRTVEELRTKTQVREAAERARQRVQEKGVD